MAEWTIESTKVYADPFNDVDVDVVFERGGQQWRVPTFWRGGSEWTVRFAPPQPGTYAYHLESTDSNNPDLNGHNGQVEITAYRGTNELLRHGMIRVSSNKRYFEHTDGTPFFWLGDTWWAGLSTRLSWNGFKTLTADRQKKGFTVVQLVAGLVPAEVPPMDPGNENEGGPVWDKDFKRINPRYFDYADRRIQHLIAAGIVPAIVGAWRDILNYTGEKKMEKHWRYIIARYGAYPVFWIVGGEVIDPPQNVRSQLPDFVSSRITRGWTDVARYIRATDPYHHPMTVHEFVPPGDYPLQDESLTDFDMFQAGHGEWQSLAINIAQLDRHYARVSMTKPLVEGEIGYEKLGETHLEDFQRMAFWFSMLNGAAGHTYGANGTWESFSADKPFFRGRLQYSLMSWREGMNLPGSYQVGLGAGFLRQFQWWRFAPHPEWVIPRGTTLLRARHRVNGFDLDLDAWEPAPSDSDLLNAQPGGTLASGKPRKSFWRAYAAGIPDEVRVIYAPYFGLQNRRPPTVLGLEQGVPYDAFFWQPAQGITVDLGLVKRPDPGPILFSDKQESRNDKNWERHSHVEERGTTVTDGTLSILNTYTERDAVATCSTSGLQTVGIVLRYRDPNNYVAGLYSPGEKGLYVIERRAGLDGLPLGMTSVPEIATPFHLTSEVRGDKAIVELATADHIYHTPIVDLSASEPGRVGVLELGRDPQGFTTFELRRSATMAQDSISERDLRDARGQYRGTMAGGGMTSSGVDIQGWNEFGRDKHILLDAYRPERMPTVGDWVLVLKRAQ